MKNQLQVFENEEFGQVRALDIDGAPWFVGKDITEILGYRNGRDALRIHADEEDKADVVIHDGRQNRSMTVINESGLYSLVLSSKLPKAKSFKRWVTSEVLPSIRKHGAYITDEALAAAAQNQDFAFDLFQKLIAEKGKNIALQGEVQTLTPKARYCDIILQCKNTVPVSIIAKDYGYSATAFNRLLHNLRIQYKVNGTWVLYQSFAGNGYTHSRTYYTAEGNASVHTHWTQKGRLFLYNALLREGIVPLAEQWEDDCEFEFFEDFGFDEGYDFFDGFGFEYEEAL